MDELAIFLNHSLTWQAAGPLFVAAADFRRRESPADGAKALNYMCVLLHIMETFVNGFRYEPSINANAPPTGNPTILLMVSCLYFGSFPVFLNIAIW